MSSDILVLEALSHYICPIINQIYRIMCSISGDYVEILHNTVCFLLKSWSFTVSEAIH